MAQSYNMGLKTSPRNAQNHHESLVTCVCMLGKMVGTLRHHRCSHPLYFQRPRRRSVDVLMRFVFLSSWHRGKVKLQPESQNFHGNAKNSPQSFVKDQVCFQFPYQLFPKAKRDQSGEKRSAYLRPVKQPLEVP